MAATHSAFSPPEQLAGPIAGALLHRVVRFGRALRAAGLDAGPGRLADFVSALPLLDLSRRDDFYYAARATLLARPDQRELFDSIFAQFWPPGRMLLDAAEAALDGPPSPQTSPQPGDDQGQIQPDEADARRVARAAAGRSDEPPAEERPQDARVPGTAVMSYSPDEVLREKNFGDFTDEELERARRLMEKMRWRAALRLTRRLVPARRGQSIDLRRTMRRALTTGGETLSWAKRRRKLKPRPLVLICDVSGSMERYTRLLLQFLHAVSQGAPAPVETFVFATRLTRITTSLKRRRVQEALERVSREVADWSGGTRTGEALAAFNRVWARRVLGRGAVVLIISDGWDRGDVDQLAREMARLRRTSYRLIWLNPLLGSPNYRPLTRGMQAALPHLDDFLPVHNLESLEALVEKLAALPVRRTADRETKGRSPFIPRQPHRSLFPSGPRPSGGAST